MLRISCLRRPVGGVFHGVVVIGAMSVMPKDDKCHAEIGIVLAHALGRGVHEAEALDVGDLHGLERVEVLMDARS